jgi:hypothetical protein
MTTATADPIGTTMAAADLTIRPDLVDAYRTSWRHIASPGSWWDGEQRLALARVAAGAYAAKQPLPPWVTPSTVAGALPDDLPVPDAAADVAYRVARHAGTLTEDWYSGMLERGLTPLQYVEIVGVVVAVVPVLSFCRGVGVDPPVWPATESGEATGDQREIVDGSANWVPVDVAFEGFPGVVQALTGVPGEFAHLGATHGAQYIPFEGMGDMTWTRGPLDRRQIEYVAARLSVLRECFY